MTKKDYELIAYCVRETRLRHTSDDAEAALDEVAHTLADSLALENERFDRVRFLAACGA